MALDSERLRRLRHPREILEAIGRASSCRLLGLEGLAVGVSRRLEAKSTSWTIGTAPRHCLSPAGSDWPPSSLRASRTLAEDGISPALACGEPIPGGVPWPRRRSRGNSPVSCRGGRGAWATGRGLTPDQES